MKLKKAVLVFCCLVGCLGVANAQFGRGAFKKPATKKPSSHSAFKKTPQDRAAKKAHQAKWSYRQKAEADLHIGRALLRDEMPSIGENSGYARRAKWGEKWMPRLSPKVFQTLVNRHILETSFPGYITNFMYEFRVFEEESELSWTGELSKALGTYGPEAKFVGGFVPSFSEAVEFLERPGLWWTDNAKNALDEAWFRGTQLKSGFFVIAVRSPLVKDGKDVLLLDTKGKRFISISQSVEAATPKSTYALAPVGDVQIGRALLTNQVENIFYPGYIPRFWRSYEAREREFGVDEWTKVLQTYGKDAYFYVDFKSSFKEVVSYRPEDALYWAGETEGAIGYHLWQVVEESTQKVGFLVVYLKRNNPAAATAVEEDVLILDLENKRFISLEESRRLAEEEK